MVAGHSWGRKPGQSWSESESRAVCQTLCDPMDYTVHGILQAIILKWVAFTFSKGSSQPRDWAQASHNAGGFFTSWATREAQEYWSGSLVVYPADLPDPGIELGSPALQVYSLPTELSGKSGSIIVLTCSFPTSDMFSILYILLFFFFKTGNHLVCSSYLSPVYYFFVEN